MQTPLGGHDRASSVRRTRQASRWSSVQQCNNDVMSSRHAILGQSNLGDGKDLRMSLDVTLQLWGSFLFVLHEFLPSVSDADIYKYQAFAQTLQQSKGLGTFFKFANDASSGGATSGAGEDYPYNV
ncbi:cell division control protein 48 D-like [Pyrus ussuriensis x Pyrus communis]|uniref:Cell division control protein 48 D-like n=1 Tax=Pyrus ussuriensis x Pyrus communis TaxID=2448454 RepID=A0A5N5G8I2_9ROSA|nr:cell division control protein 48 D-like [Pyrus ussuriensis x Pyrus communis]